MKAEYRIDTDRRKGIVNVTMAGFFQEADVREFVRALLIKLDELGTLPNEHLMLCDVRGMKIQPQDIVAAFGRVVGSPALRSRRLAFVTGSSLSRLQTMRLTDRKGVSFFNDVRLAEEWLMSDIEEPLIDDSAGFNSNGVVGQKLALGASPQQKQSSVDLRGTRHAPD